MPQQNWFPTLNAALDAADMVGSWPLGKNLSYGENFSFITDDFYHVSVYRETNGMYERPVVYSTITKQKRAKLNAQTVV